MGVQLDSYSVVLLIRRPDAPKLDEQAAAHLQDAHMANLAALHGAGQLIASGPLFDEEFRGLSIFTVEPDQARALMEQDLAVRAGRFSLMVMQWMVPHGVMSFSRAPLPRSMSEVDLG